MKLKKKNKLFLNILLFLFVSIGLGYSYLSTSLGIDIGLRVSKRRNVYIDSIEIVDGSITAAEDPVADKMSTNLFFNVPFSDINDTYSFKVHLKNDTVKSFMLNDIIIDGYSGMQKDLFDVNIFYSSGDIPQKYDLFYNDTNVLIFEVKLKDDITGFTPEIVALNISIDYVYSNNALISPYYYLAGKSSESFVDFSDSTIASGIYKSEETKNYNYPVYFFRGNVSDNNLLFNNKCWKIMRTTDTRGVKIVYAGLPSSVGSCSNTGLNSSLNTSSYNFNDSRGNLSKLGYMFNSNIDDIESYSTNISLSYPYTKRTNSYNYYYYYTRSSTLTYSLSGSTCTYRVSSSSSSFTGWTDFSRSAQQFTKTASRFTSGTTVRYSCSNVSSSSYLNYYVFNAGTTSCTVSGSTTSCPILYYVSSSNYNNYVYFSSEFEKNSDGTYTLIDPVSMRAHEWYSAIRSDYYDMYTCDTLTYSSTCNGLIKINNSSTSVTYSGQPLIKYGNDVTYSNGVYTLVDVVDSFTTDKSVIDEKYHYTCLNGETSCESVSYLLSDQYKITFNNGDKMESLFSNETDSNAKSIVDSWYESDMINVDNLIEDTVYCNDRSSSSGSTGSKDTAIADIKFGSYDRNKVLFEPSIVCPLKRDSFTKSSSLGNGKLTYPVGLITYDEVVMAGNQNSYLSYDVMTMSPAFVNITSNTTLFNYNSNGSSFLDNSYYVRPVVSLKYGVRFFGSGTTSDPYRVLSSFTLDGKSYYYEPGMTWEEWVNSDYNTDNLLIEEYCSGTYIKKFDLDKVVYNGTSLMSPTDLINSGTSYTFIDGRGCDD